MYGDMPIPDAFAHAASLGYSGIEIAPFTLGSNVYEITKQTKQQIRDSADSHELQIVGLHWLLAQTEGLHLTSSDVGIQKNTANYLCELTRLCSELGGLVMVFGSPHQRNLIEGMSHAEGAQNATKILQDVVPTLEELGITLAMEPLGPEEGNFLRTADAAIELAQAIDSPNVRLHLDVKAMSTESKPIEQIIRDSGDWTAHFHANDPNRLGPGMGEVNYEPIFGALIETNYQGWISVEAFDYSPGIDRLASESIKYMKSVADQVTG